MFYHFINYGVNSIIVKFIPGSCSVSINNSMESDGTVNDAISAIRNFLVTNKQFLVEDKVINIKLVANNRGKDTLQVNSDMRDLRNRLHMIVSSYKCKFNIQSCFHSIG